jgi:insertion element IS1 protein InsB
MAEAVVRRPHCQSDAVVKYGRASNGKARFRCQQRERCGRTFLQTYAYPGRLPYVKQQMVEMTLNGSGIRDIARVLHVGPNTVIKELKKASALSLVNTSVVEGCCPDAITVEVRRVEAAEVDEMWSFVGKKAHQRWLWHAIDHLTGVVLAYALGSRADTVFVKLQKLLKPFGLVHFYTDAAGVYERYLPASAHTVGKLYTQQIERKHLTLRTRIKRLARKTICFSKSVLMHDAVIGLFVNRYEFGTPI